MTFDYNSHDYEKEKPTKSWIGFQLLIWLADGVYAAITAPFRLAVGIKELFFGSLKGDELGSKYDAFHKN